MENNYPKIDLYVNGQYACSTTWSKTCKQAIQNFMVSKDFNIPRNKIKAHFSKGKGL